MKALSRLGGFAGLIGHFVDFVMLPLKNNVQQTLSLVKFRKLQRSAYGTIKVVRIFILLFYIWY